MEVIIDNNPSVTGLIIWIIEVILAVIVFWYGGLLLVALYFLIILPILNMPKGDS